MIDNKTKSTFDWFLNKKQINQVVILLIVIIGVIGYLSYNGQKSFEKELDNLEVKIHKQDSIINILRLENQALKYQGILLLDAYKDDPNPRWITDSRTHHIVSVNDAYERIHLKPRGYTRFDLIGTTGEHIFGSIVTTKFIPNNELVLRLGRAISFRDEINPTVKYPIGKNDYIYAIGGEEFLNHK